MADIEDVARNEDMVRIANAIRAVTRTTGRMTIPQMPERLLDIQVVITRDVTANFSTGDSVSLGIYDKAIKHLFVVTPSTTADSAILAKVNAELALVYDETTGLLSASFARPKAEASAVHLKVVDLLLGQSDTSAGFLVNQGTGGGAGIAEQYDSTREYELGETFLYGDSFGITLVAHTAEEYNPEHNTVVANQLYDGLEYKDLAYFATVLATKFDADKVKNEYSDKQDEVYSAQYANGHFAPLALAQPFYAKKTSTTEALLQKEQPVADAGNILSTTTVNTEYDWTSPDFRFRLVLDTGVTLSKTNSFNVALPFRISRDSNISFGSRVKVSRDNGQTWTYISTAHAYGAEDFQAQTGNTYVFVVTLDALTELTTYEEGTIFELEVYKKQLEATALTTTVYCGVAQSGTVINTVVQFVVANINIDTAQIEDGAVTTPKIADGAVTYAKLAQNIKDVVDNALLKPTNPQENVFTYVDAQGVQHYIGIDPMTLEIVDNRLSAGIELVEV